MSNTQNSFISADGQCASIGAGKSVTALPIVPVRVKAKGSNTSTVTYAFLDSGSNTTLFQQARGDFGYRRGEDAAFPYHPRQAELGSCVFCAPLDQHIGQHIDRQTTDVSVDILAECRPICRSTYRSSVGQYVDQDVSLDISADISVKHRSICRLTLNRYVGRYVD